MIEATSLRIEGAKLIQPARHGDDRGFFSEVYNRRTFAEIGIEDTFVQDNHSLSEDKGVVRGLHFQTPPNAISKLIRVVRGAIWDVVVDLRTGSQTYGEHEAVVLSADEWNQLYVPVGLAHGFCTIEPHTEVAYKVTDYWSPDVDHGVAWDDPDLNVEWPVGGADAILSDKDRNQPAFGDLPRYFEVSS